MVDDSVTLGQSPEGVPKGNQTTGRNDIDKTGLSVFFVPGDGLSTTASNKLPDVSSIFVRNINLKILERFAFDAIDDLGDNLRLRDLKLETFPAPSLD